MKEQYLHNFFGAILMMLLDLLVRKFEDLKTIWEGALSSLGLIEEVDNPLVCVGLLYISVFEVHYCVSVQESLSAYTIGEDDLFLPIEVQPLYLTVCSPDLALYCDIGVVIIVVFIRIDDIEIVWIKSSRRTWFNLVDLYFESRLLISPPLALGRAFLSDLLLNALEL